MTASGSSGDICFETSGGGTTNKKEKTVFLSISVIFNESLNDCNTCPVVWLSLVPIQTSFLCRILIFHSFVGFIACLTSGIVIRGNIFHTKHFISCNYSCQMSQKLKPTVHLMAPNWLKMLYIFFVWSVQE